MAKSKTKQIPIELYNRLKDIATTDAVEDMPDRVEPMFNELRRLMIDHLLSKAS